MADEQNKSNKSPMNGEFGMSEIEKIGQQAYTVPKVEQEQRERAKVARTQIEALSEMPEDYILNNKVLRKYAKTAPNNLMSAEERIKSSVSSRLERSNIQAANAVGRDYAESTISSLARRGYEDPAFQNKALTMMNTPYESLAKRREEISGQISTLGAQSVEAAGSVFSNRGPRKDLTNQIAGNAEQANTLVKELTSIDLAIKTKRQTGSDPLSKFEKLNAVGKSAEDLLSARSIGEELSKGGVDIKDKKGGTVNVATGDINKALTQEAENLKRALTDLATTTETSKDKLDEMRKSAEVSAENFEKLSKAAGAGGGGGNRDTVGYLNAAAGGFNAIGGAGQQIMINQRMQQVSNISGFAGLANQQYDMYTKARSGDIASQLALSQFDKADDFGAEMKNATNIVQGAQALGAAAQTTAGVIQTTEAAGQKFNPGAYITGSSTQNTAALQQGALNVVQGGANLAVIGSDVARGTSAEANRLAGIQSQMQARQAINQVGAQQAQGLRDFYTGLDVVGQDMGSKASGFIQNATSGANLQKMQDARMSPEQFLQMSKAGAAQIGSTFDTEQVYAARNLESRGMGNMQTNMQRMASLAGAGANNPKEGMETVLSAAVARGLDSSKSINLMVDHTASIMQASSQSTAAGINNTASIATELAANTNPNTKNKEFALERAAQVSDVVNKVTTDTSASFTGMVNTARIGQQTGLSGTNSLFAAKLTPADIRSLEGMAPEEAKEALLKKGIDPTEAKGGVSGLLKTLKTTQTQQMFTGSGALAFGTNEERDELTAAATTGKNYDKLSPSQKALLGKIGTTSGLTGEEFYSGAAGISNITNVSGAAGKELTEGKGPDDIKKQMDNLRTSGFKQLSEAAATASTNLEKFGGALKVFTDLTQKYEKGGTKNEETFSTAASDMAKDFKASTGLFKGSVDEFSRAVQVLSSKAGLDSNRNPVKPTFMDNKDSLKGSTRGN